MILPIVKKKGKVRVERKSKPYFRYYVRIDSCYICYIVLET